MQISPHKVVLIHYTLTNDEGDVLDSSGADEPLAYIHGLGNLISGLEEALAGRVVGDSFRVTVPPEEAYGLHDENLVQAVPRNAFEGVDEILPGMQFHAESNEGVQIVTVLEVLEDEVVLDGNHPMAGMTLHFEVEVAGIRDATPEELEHGHLHGPGGLHY